MIHNISRYLLTLVALFAMTAGAWAGTQATGSFDNCTGHKGSIHVHGWAYDPDASETSIYVHAYIWYGTSIGSSKEERLPAVGILADIERPDVNTAKGITGNHGFNKYVAVPAGTYTVQIFAIDQNKDGNPSIPGPTSGGNYQTYTVTVDAPFTVSFDANGGSDAPANQDKCTGIDLKLSSDQPVREGYIFVGWNTAQDGSGDSYDPGATYTANADLTLYAQWLKVTLDENSIVATMKMPAFDVTVDYELVRDMAINVNAVVTDRIRIQKDASSSAYEAVTATELIPAVSDKISGTAVAMTVTTDYTAKLQKKTEGDTPSWADVEALSVGTFRYVITGAGLYDGEITTNEFQLFEGYEVTVPAGEYITYYKDEALYVENENAKLYTIASITESEAVLSSEISVAPALTPLLVFNSSDEAKTFLLIPTTDKTPDNVTAATQFVGTLEATTIPASATGADNYALNGYAFVWVKTAIEVGANKCWLHIASQPAAARAMTRSIVGGGDTTGIDAIENVTIDNEGWYDLQGRKLQAKPNRGGIYIHNGKKVIVR